MLEIILFVAGAVALGAAVARWWLVPLPLIVAAAWVVVAAAVGGEDREGMPVWQLAAFFGTVWGGAGMLGLILGVGWGRWARDRRSERSQPFSR
jgi:hypothetical protein